MFIEELVARLREIAERSPGSEVRVGLDPREPTELAVTDVLEVEGDSGPYVVILALEI